jgi:FAD synthetase
MMKVLVGGTFDVLHEGHRFFLNEAKKQGDHLIVVVARDEHVKEFKKLMPHHSEKERVKAVQSTGIADEVVLGRHGSIFDILSELKPDVICLGYDQSVKEDILKAELVKRRLNAYVVRLGAYKPDIYKSSRIRSAMPKD